jgi:hypothetical protein
MLCVFLMAALLLAACGGGEPAPTRTPIPTWTPTPDAGAAAPPAPGDVQAAPPAAPAGEIGSQVVDPTQVAVAIATDTPTPLPTDTPTATPSPTPLPTETPTVTPTPPPTETPLPTPTPDYGFALEASEKFPTDSLAPNVVRIYAYVYSPAEFGLPGYTLRVVHNGTELVVDESSLGGVPSLTRDEVSPYSRFSNLSVIFVEPQEGEWRVQALDGQGIPIGPEAIFNLTADENTRELYVRYRQE